MRQTFLYKGHHDTYYTEVTNTSCHDTFKIEIYSNDSRLMGGLSFYIDGEKAWLSNINVIEKYRYKGVGQALIEIFEYLSAINYVVSIAGIYSPGNEYAKDFYAKNDYTINKYDFEDLIEKEIDPDEIIEQSGDRFIDLNDMYTIGD